MKTEFMIWNGHFFSLSKRRHWMTFFGYATIFEIRKLNLQKILDVRRGYHIAQMYYVVEAARPQFRDANAWYSFSQRTCDQYCDYYLMGRPLDGNAFRDYRDGLIRSIQLNEEAAIVRIAEASKEYIARDDSWAREAATRALG